MKANSKVGIITNSSSEIYTFPREDAVEIAHDYLQAFIEPGTKVEDSFKIELRVIESELDYCVRTGDIFFDEMYDKDILDIKDSEGNVVFTLNEEDTWKQERERWEQVPIETREQIIVDFLLEEGKKWYESPCGPPKIEIIVEVLPGAKLIKPVDVKKVVDICSITESIYC